ncbi:MAG TPA: alpha/beta hydrolase-fold protein [Chitinophagaceae bacterium]|nr:alpha/beta hydrolase-fold protein [Chitinophagaceae bacterium]
MIANKVCVLDSAFYIPQLNRYRRIWVYLPPGYCNSRDRYPVLYMNDGQNVFNTGTSYAGEWEVDKTINDLSGKVGGCIVIAIDNGGEQRMSEYAPYDFQAPPDTKVKGEGAQYADFIVNTLKPFVDKHYRTRRLRRHTYIGGSSMGGLIAFYAVLKYPNKFGGAAIFSPAFWTAPLLKNDIMKMGSKVKARLYFYAGKDEGANMLPGMLSVVELMSKSSKAKLTTVIREGKHNEAAWRKEFPLFYTWLFEGSSTGR